MSKFLQNIEDKDISKMKEFLLDSFFSHVCSDKLMNNKELSNIHKNSIATKNFDLVSIAMSYLALNNYRQGARYYQTLNLLNDAKYLANSSNDLIAQKINIFCSSLIEYYEKNIEVAINLIKASLYIKTISNYNFDEAILKYKQKIENENQQKTISSTPPSFIPNEIKDDALLALLQVGRTIAIETNIDSLLTIIAQQIQQALQADRCTVFLLDEETNELWSKVALGLEMQEIRFAANKGLAGHVAMTGETINIKNAYESEYFNKDIDLQTGYKTRNILCMPIRNLSHQIVGVFQVLNKFNGDFSQKDEDLLIAIGSSAGIALENAHLFSKQKKLIEEQKKLFSSFINTLSVSIDARDKITSGHSKRVTLYANLICEQCRLSEEEKEIIKNASLLHDIGKIGIKDSVLQKEGKLTPEEYEHIKEHVRLTHNILSKVYITNNFKDVARIASSHHEKYDGTGYFKGLKGEQIPLGGRILAVSDVFDAITSKRHYRDKMKIKDALQIMIEGKNTHFDENLVNAFMSISTYEILKIIVNDVTCKFGDDEIILKEFNLSQLYDILNIEENSITEKQKKLTETFNKYYYYNSEG
ncbi:MAG: HD domain-containing protein [Candidatus Gastranaerophilales bacterium]|nr:HD domain-containing protein [Candidatus Gastranaerophilales bacterium]